MQKIVTLWEEALNLVKVLRIIQRTFEEYPSSTHPGYCQQWASEFKPLVNELENIVLYHGSRDMALDVLTYIKDMLRLPLFDARAETDLPRGQFWREYDDLAMIFQETRFSGQEL